MTIINNKKRILIIIIISVLCVAVLFFIEQVLNIPYSIKTIFKIPLFVIIPFAIKKFLLKEKLSYYMKKNHLKLTLLCSVFVILIIMLAFSIANGFIDTSLIVADFEDRMKITKSTFIFIAVYTIIGNAFIEEYFFRGFIFQSLHNKGLTKSAYLLSALLFALYHIGVFLTWFTIPIMIIVLFGLFSGGMIFAFFVQKTNSVLASYFIHISADIAIVLIGIFGMRLYS